MTIREATAEAHKRMGHPEWAVRDAFRSADMDNPTVNTNLEIPPGAEEAVIQQIILFFRAAAPKDPAELRRRLRAEDKKRQASN